MYVTYDDLIQIGLLVVAIIGLVLEINVLEFAAERCYCKDIKGTTAHKVGWPVN